LTYTHTLIKENLGYEFEFKAHYHPIPALLRCRDPKALLTFKLPFFSQSTQMNVPYKMQLRQYIDVRNSFQVVFVWG